MRPPIREEIRFRDMMGKDINSFAGKVEALAKAMFKRPEIAYNLLGFFCVKEKLINEPDYDDRINNALGTLDDWLADEFESREDLKWRLYSALANTCVVC